MSGLCEYNAPLFCRLISEPLATVIGLLGTCPEESVEHFYCQVMAAYLSGNTVRLKALCEHGRPGFALALAQLRLQIREQENIGGIAVQCVEQLVEFEDEIISGEAAFVLGLYHTQVTMNLSEAGHFYFIAYKKLEKACPQKALKSLFNQVVSETHVRPRKRYLRDLQIVRTKGNEVGAFTVVGLAERAMAHELSLMGAFKPALVLIESALALMESDRGTYNYKSTLLQKAFYLAKTGQRENAYLVLEKLEGASFPSILSGMSVVREVLGEGKSLNASSLNLHWLFQLNRHRVEKKRGTVKRMTPLESLLLFYVLEKPLSKIQIIEKLYGPHLPLEYTEKRFYDLLSRFQKKYPGLVGRQGKYFQVQEKSLLVERKEVYGELPA